jgi:hypothetical protein
LEAVFSVVRAMTVATQRRGKHVSTATNRWTKIQEFCFLFVRDEEL